MFIFLSSLYWRISLIATRPNCKFSCRYSRCIIVITDYALRIFEDARACSYVRVRALYLIRVDEGGWCIPTVKYARNVLLEIGLSIGLCKFRVRLCCAFVHIFFLLRNIFMRIKIVHVHLSKNYSRKGCVLTEIHFPPRARSILCSPIS